MSHGVTGLDGVTIRPAERADLLAIVRIENDSFPQPWPYDAFEWFLGEPAFLVAITDGSDDGPDSGPVNTNSPDDATAGPGFEAETGASIDTGGVVGYLVADVTETHGRSIGHVKDLASLLTGLVGSTGALAVLASTYAFDVSTVVYVLTVGLLSYRPLLRS